ncbi:MAG TPA: hypothetical protein VI937_00435 [Negativicutes bacterium]|nr:hypothetical protein [Negativicutes bacterium]
MSILELSQIFFNVTVAFAVILVSAFLAVICYEIIRFVKAVKLFAKNVKEESIELQRRLDRLASIFSGIPFLAGIFKKRKSKKE